MQPELKITSIETSIDLLAKIIKISLLIIIFNEIRHANVCVESKFKLDL